MATAKEKIADIAEGIGQYFLFGLILFIPIGNAGVETCFGFILVCFLIKKIIRPDFAFLKKPEHALLLIFFIFCGLSMVNSGPYIKKSLIALFLKWLKYIGVFLIAQDFLSTDKYLKRALVAVLIVAGIIGIDAIAQFFIGFDLFRHSPAFVVSIPNGTACRGLTASFKHYNGFGAYLTVVLSLAIALLFSPKKLNLPKPKQVLLFLLNGLLAVCLLLAGSRGAWLGFICGLTLMILLCRQYKRLILLTGSFIGALIVFPALRERIFSILRPEGDSLRFGVWRAAFRLIRENPFLGKGIGTFMAYYRQQRPDISPVYAHNCYLQIWAETGIFSLLTFILFLSLILYKGIKAYRKKTNPLLLGLICGLFGFLVHCFFDSHLYSLQLAFLFWLMLGSLVAATRLTVD
jgi:O-antigen ligase